MPKQDKQQSDMTHMTQQTDATKRLYLMGFVSMVLLIILMMFSGENTVNAYTEEQAMVLQNGKVEVSAVDIQASYLKQQKVYGLLESKSDVAIGFELAGSISKLNAKEGDYVAKGDVLAELDLARLDAQQAQLTASLNRAQAESEIAMLSVKRIQELVNAKLDSKQNLDQANARLKAADAAVKEVEAGLNALEVERSKSRLRAPFSGQITQQVFDLGAVVNTGQAVFNLLATEHLEARFGLPTHTAFGLKIGQTFTLDFKGMPINAQVQSISAQRNRATRAIDVVFVVDNASNVYGLSGDLVSITVDSAVETKGAWVPMSALANGVRGLWTLYIAQEFEGAYKVVRRTVAVEYIEDQRAFVSGAVAQDGLIVVNGLQRLTPNQTLSKLSVVKRDASSTSSQGE